MGEYFDIFAACHEEGRESFISGAGEECRNYLKLKCGMIGSKDENLKNFKNDIKVNGFYEWTPETIKKVQKIAGIMEKTEVPGFVKELPPYSFAIWAGFELKQPYFSRDDDDFYGIQNPVLKEKAFKVPMIRGSAWKGALAAAFRDLINEAGTNKASVIASYFRIMGAGSEYIKNLEDYFQERLKGYSPNLSDFKQNLLRLLLFELGVFIDRELIDRINEVKEEDEILDMAEGLIGDGLKKIMEEERKVPSELQTHRGRAVFYPAFFSRASLEVINPHDRKRRAGTRPIHYEVVPKGEKGILQMVYIPFDAVLKKDEEIEREMKEDLNNLLKALEKLAKQGIGAKTKLGWGTFDFREKKLYFSKVDSVDLVGISLLEKGWEKCPVCM